jgi:ubiquinol-cytochrome c reductase cytochrome b subunit
MTSLKQQVREWLDRRTGIETAIRNFLYEEIPGSSGWPQVFGGVAVFLFLLQAITGILLSLNYAPTPGDAYNSVQYIMNQVLLGRFFRGLHHWGANIMIIVVALHAIQVSLYGAYKKPREATWIVGVFLLLLTLGFGLTGYLLPWDDRAYWGTVVTTQIAHNAPLIGVYLDRLLGGEGGVGVVTFARFYGLHTLLLPALMALLITFHVYLVRRHGVAAAPGDTQPTKRFFPEQPARDVVAMFVVFASLFAIAALVPAPLQNLAHPTDTNAIPRPDWYFLFIFQSLKILPGRLEPVASVVLPGVAVLLLILVPFLDRGAPARLRQRTAALGVIAVAVLGWTALTIAAVTTTPRLTATQAPRAPSASDWRALSPGELAGIGYYRQESCSVCHNLVSGPSKVGPNLATVGERKSATWMISHFKNPVQVIPGSNMPPIHLDDAQLNALAAFLLKLGPENAAALNRAPEDVAEGAQIYLSNGCGNCHMVNGVGMKVGPPLNGLSQRRSKGWVEKHFANPPALSPGSIMPPYKFAPYDMDRIVQYLFSLSG